MRALREVYPRSPKTRAGKPCRRRPSGCSTTSTSSSAAARDIQHDLPPSFFRRLPRVAADEFAGLPRIYALALELIGSSAGRLDAQRLQRFISAFQSITPLTIGELWAWPSVLKLALIDHLRERADVLAETRAHRLAADRLASAIEVAPDGVGDWPARGASRVRHAAAAALARPRGDCVDPAPPARRRARGAGARRSRTRSAPTASTRPPSRRAWPT